MTSFTRAPHYRGFLIAVLWTLGLIWLGSVVHATGSSLACPDWPTCYGEWMPAMEGGIFWEHLHRLVAGGLVLIFLGATYLAWREEPARPWVWKAGALGILLLLIQSVLGGVTVIMELPTAISTSHLTLAFIFLGLSVVLALATSPRRSDREGPKGVGPGWLAWGTAGAVLLVLIQSLVGGLVRHMGAGLACPDVPLCYGQVIPPLESSLVAVHFGHRVIGVLLALGVIGLAWAILRADLPRRVRDAAAWAAGLVVVQVLLGILAVHQQLAVLPASLHTLGAALLVCILVAQAFWLFELRTSSPVAGGPGAPHPSEPRPAAAPGE